MSYTVHSSSLCAWRYRRSQTNQHSCQQHHCPAQPGGGIGPAIQGTLILVGLTIIIGVPLGVLSGIYLSEFGDNPVGRIIRFLNDVLAEFPSVVIGVVIFSLIVLTLRSFSVVAGAFALSIIMLPVVSRSP